jgi:Mycobacterium membrane protein
MRMVRAAFATAVMVGGCLAVAGCVTIRYEVTGDSGTANNVTYMINQGEQQETNVALPWSKEFTADGKFQAFVVNAQNAGAGSISCKITVAGQVINQQTSNGQYAVVMCSGS